MQVTRWLVTCILAIAIVNPVQAGEVRWTKKFKKDIKYKKLTAAGIYLVLTDEGLFGLDPRTGVERWSVVDEKLKVDDIEYIEGSPLFLVTRTKGFTRKTSNMSAISIMDGQEIWRVEGIEGILVGNEPIPEHGLVLLFSMGGKDGIAINAFDIYDGSHKYKIAFPENQEMKRVSLKKSDSAGALSTRIKVTGHQQPVVDGDHLIMYYDYLRKIDLKTGRQIWMDEEEDRAEPVNAPLLRSDYAQMFLQDGVIYTPYEKGMAAVDAASGEIKWRIEKLEGERVTSIVSSGGAFIVRSGGFMKGSGKNATLVDPVYSVMSPSDGAMVWEKSYKLKGGGTNMQVVGDKMYTIGAGKNLHIINMADSKETAEKQIKFKDAPHTITYRKDGLLVQSDQTVALYDIRGGDPKEMWTQYYKASGAFGYKSKMRMAAVNATAAMDASRRALRAYRVPSANRTANNLRQKTFNAFIAAINARVTATRSSDRYQYVLTKLDDGVGLKGINLKTGAADREVLFKDKNPQYDLDEMGGVLFYQKKKELTCFKLD